MMKIKTAPVLSVALLLWICLVLSTPALAGLPARSFASQREAALGEMNFYRGNLHSHTAYSDGQGTPAQAFAWARDNVGFDFYAVTDHGEQTSSAEWADTGVRADQFNQDGSFVAMRGFEWSSGTYGHVTVLNTAGYTSSGRTRDLQSFYAWVTSNGGYGEFNHPARSVGTFNEFNYYGGAYSSNMCALETGNSGVGNDDGWFYAPFLQALDNGWKIAPVSNQDNHSLRANAHRTVAVCPALTRTNILSAIAARRVYSSDDPSMEVIFKLGDDWMGSRVERKRGQLTFEVLVGDDEDISRLELVSNGGVVVASQDYAPGAGSPQVSWNPSVTFTRSSYYFLKVTERDTNNEDDNHAGTQVTLTAPIWVTAAAKDFSIKVEAGGDITAERPMYFNYHGTCTGGTTEGGAEQAGTTWYLAEGATHPGFDEYICLQNPSDVAADVDITYMFPGGAPTQQQSVSVPPNSRSTVGVVSAVGYHRDVSVRVDSSQPVVVERPMYFNSGPFVGSSVEAAVASPSSTWYFAEGATHAGIQEWITLMNPGPTKADVEILYMLGGGETLRQTLEVPPTSRETVDVNLFVGPDEDVSAKVTASSPIVAERPMYFLYGGAWSGGHTEAGAPEPASTWLLSEGSTRNNAFDGSFVEWISIQNPSENEAEVRLLYMFAGGGTQEQVRTVPAHSRDTVKVNEAVEADRDVSVLVTSPEPVVVERPMYFNYHGRYSGGDVEKGCSQTGRTWHFAEGTVRAGFEEWLTLMNPGASAVAVTITYMFDDGSTVQQAVVLPAQSRTTIDVGGLLGG